ncbi:M20 family metallo-hydrolase [Vulcanisaeta thermophila]|uniref:M20 family metallo-hydrolase n=1 Tax=Vulcanisaeta thermophila TaxID=867917 RepID=UPI000853E2C0|nr:M20 family metallo-hydrolase [Vulcanisaeta thermophila]
MASNEINRVLRHVDELRDYVINLCREFIPIKALAPENGGDGEWDRAEYFLGIMKDLFNEVRVIEAPDPRAKRGSRPNIVGLIRGLNTERTYWVIAHMDTVPEGDKSLWTHEPFRATVINDVIYGRGVEDDGQGIVMGLTAAKALRDLGIKPPVNLGIMLAADEEVGSRYGIRYVIDKEPGLIKPTDLVLVPDAGNPEGTMIEVSEKGILWIKVTVYGKQAHASLPELGLNAHRLGAELMLELDRALHEKFKAEDPLFVPPKSTFEPTKVEPNVGNVNTIPGKHVFYIDCRVLPTYPLDDVLNTVNNVSNEFCAKHGCKVTVEVVSREDPAPPTDPNSEIVRRLANAIRLVKNKEAKPMGIGGGTYAKYLRMRGIPAAVWMTTSETAHAPDEHVNINDVLSDVKVVLASLLT